MRLLSSSFALWASLAAGLGLECFTGTAAAQPEGSFPQALTRADILRWLTGNSDLTPDAVVAMTDELVVAVTDRQDGRGAGGSTRLTLREEVISPDAATAWGGRSILLDLDLDCSRRRVMLGTRRIYARSNLQGSARVSRSDDAWTEAPPNTVIDDVAKAICTPEPPTQTAAVSQAPPAIDRMASPPEPAKAPKAPAVQLAAAEPALGKTISFDPPASVGPRAVTTVAPPAPSIPGAAVPAEPATPPRDGNAPVDSSEVIHNPFVAAKAGEAAASSRGQSRPSAPPKPPAPPAGPFRRPPDVAVQIAAAASADEASDNWQALKARLPALVGPLTFAAEPVEANGRTLYRALLLGFASPDEAAALCKELRSQSVDCVLRQMR